MIHPAGDLDVRLKALIILEPESANLEDDWESIVCVNCNHFRSVKAKRNVEDFICADSLEETRL